MDLHEIETEMHIAWTQTAWEFPEVGKRSDYYAIPPRLTTFVKKEVVDAFVEHGGTAADFFELLRNDLQSMEYDRSNSYVSHWQLVDDTEFVFDISILYHCIVVELHKETADEQ